jgi:hypothetical protein
MELHCTVTAYIYRIGSEVSVTGQAEWWVSEEPFSQNPTLTPVAEIPSPGVVVPRQHGAVYVNAAYSDEGYRGVAAAAHSFLVDPANAPIALAPYIQGNVKEPSGASIGGAVVEITDGPDAGKQDISRVNAAYFINHIHMSLPFTVRVSKVGYVTVEQQHDAIFDNEAGYALSPPVNFVLSPR